MPSPTNNLVPFDPKRGNASTDPILSKDLLSAAEYFVATMAHTPFTAREIVIKEPIGTTGEERIWKLKVRDPDIGHTIAGDQDVFMAIMDDLQRGDFGDNQVRVNRHQICKTLGWAPNKQRYQQISGACERLMNVTFTAENTFVDPLTKERFGRIKFNVVSAYLFMDKIPTKTQLQRIKAHDSFADALLQEELPLSYIRVSEEFLMLAKHTQKKMLDLGFYKSLSRPEVKWLYRFLDKNLHNKPQYKIGLRKLRRRQGLVEPLEDKYIKRKLKPRLDELKERGFLSTYEFEKKGGPDDPWHMVVRPGPQFHVSRGKRNRKDPNPTEAVKSAPEGQNGPNTRSLEDSLVRYWRERRGFPQEGAISRSDRKTAGELLAQLESLDEAKHAIDFALERAGESGLKEPEFFSFVLQNNYPERSRARETTSTEDARTAEAERRRQGLIDGYSEAKARHLDHVWEALSEGAQEAAIEKAIEQLREKHRDTIKSWPENVLRATAQRHARQAGADFPELKEWLETHADD